MIKACILDMDGVIVDTEAIHMQSFRIFLQEQSVQFSERFIQSLIGFSVHDNVQKIKTRFFKNSFDVDEGIKRRKKIYINLLSQTQLNPLPGILEIISFCQENHIKLALATSSDWQQVRIILNQVIPNYNHIFKAIVTGEEVTHKKPAPDIYRQVVEKLHVPALSCIAFEDSSAGVASAMSAGVICFAVRNQYFNDVHLNKAHKIINSVQEAIDNNFWGF